MEFSKIFDSKKYGQILVKADVGEDNAPEIRYYFKPEKLGVCSVAIGFSDDDHGWKLQEHAYQAQTLETSENMVTKAISSFGMEVVFKSD